MFKRIFDTIKKVWATERVAFHERELIALSHARERLTDRARSLTAKLEALREKL